NAVCLGCDETIAVGIYSVAVDPVLLVFTQSVRVNLTGSNYEVTQFAVDDVAVHRQGVSKAVEVTQLLHLRKGRRQDIWILKNQVENSLFISSEHFIRYVISNLIVNLSDFLIS